MVILLFKLFLVGVYYHEDFSSLAKYQTTIETSVELPRGKVFDRNGKVIVDNENITTLNYINSDINTSEQKWINAKCF